MPRHNLRILPKSDRHIHNRVRLALTRNCFFSFLLLCSVASKREDCCTQRLHLTTLYLIIHFGLLKKQISTALISFPKHTFMMKINTHCIRRFQWQDRRKLHFLITLIKEKLKKNNRPPKAVFMSGPFKGPAQNKTIGGDYSNGCATCPLVR